ncbi:MAG: branched-chain amino acid ABC transporter permease, partial [Erysipelotrichaceae bacterium]|nr:branched-chain amino acid ABC transporter permease [Erysipelotrichaceae bacterium]
WSGLISLGTAGFMGLGAYIAAYVTVNLKLPFEVSLLLGLGIPLIIGVLVGLISLRIEGLYLAIATLSVSEILRKSFEELGWFTNGFSGKSAAYPKLLGFITLDKYTTYIMLVFFLIAVMILVNNLINGQMGRALNAMRGSEAAAQAMGVNLLKYRLVAFALATSLAALSGVLYMSFIKYTYPATWTLGMSLNILAVIIIGGVRNLYGTVLGAFVVFAMPDLFLKQIPYFGTMPGFAYIVNGILIILVILFYPRGLIYIGNDFKKLWGKLKARVAR